MLRTYIYICQAPIYILKTDNNKKKVKILLHIIADSLQQCGWKTVLFDLRVCIYKMYTRTRTRL